MYPFFAHLWNLVSPTSPKMIVTQETQNIPPGRYEEPPVSDHNKPNLTIIHPDKLPPIRELLASGGIGYLEIVMGPMFSGKTTALIKQYHISKEQGKRVFIFNYSEDLRYSDCAVVSHDKEEAPCVFSETLSEIWVQPKHVVYSDVHNADIILINEAQFFPDIYECVLNMIEVHHKRVYLYGLDGDFKRNAFLSPSSSKTRSYKGWLDLIPYADSVEKKTAMCKMCPEKAIFSHRLTHEDKQKVIGTSNYIPLCRTCYLYVNTK